MALGIEIARLITGDTAKHDYAAGEWFITDENGDSVPFFSTPQKLGSGMEISDRYNGDPVTRDHDAEQKLMRAWQGSGNEMTAFLAMKVLWLMGIHAVLHVVVFTQLTPCG